MRLPALSPQSAIKKALHLKKALHESGQPSSTGHSKLPGIDCTVNDAGFRPKGTGKQPEVIKVGDSCGYVDKSTSPRERNRSAATLLCF